MGMHYMCAYGMYPWHPYKIGFIRTLKLGIFSVVKYYKMTFFQFSLVYYNWTAIKRLITTIKTML